MSSMDELCEAATELRNALTKVSAVDLGISERELVFLCLDIGGMTGGLYALSARLRFAGETECEHDWVTHRNPETPDGPGEDVVYCKICGQENNEEL